MTATFALAGSKRGNACGRAFDQMLAANAQGTYHPNCDSDCLREAPDQFSIIGAADGRPKPPSLERLTASNAKWQGQFYERSAIPAKTSQLTVDAAVEPQEALATKSDYGAVDGSSAPSIGTSIFSGLKTRMHGVRRWLFSRQAMAPAEAC